MGRKIHTLVVRKPTEGVLAPGLKSPARRWTVFTVVGKGVEPKGRAAGGLGRSQMH